VQQTQLLFGVVVHMCAVFQVIVIHKRHAGRVASRTLLIVEQVVASMEVSKYVMVIMVCRD
jgi:hypothetical protein